MKKRILTTSLFAFLSLAGYAQKEECQSKASLFVEAAKVKNYNEAYEPWKFVYDNCPELYQSTFLYGERILRDKIQQGTDKAKYIKDLQELYNKFHKYFPNKLTEGDLNIRQSGILIDYNLGTREELYNLLDKTFQLNKELFTDYMIFYQYFA